MFEKGDRVLITAGPYEGRHGTIYSDQNDDTWYVTLDDHGKLALVATGDMELEESD